MLTHLLLQYLPAAEPALRLETARRIVAREAGSLAETDAHAAIDDVMRLLAVPAHAGLFGPSSRAEVRVAGRVMVGGTEIAVSGQIDRIAVGKGEVYIADFKTNRAVPEKAADAPRAYILQLALYRELLKQIYPGHTIKCCLLWTRIGRLMPLDDGLMDRALAELTLS
jgi:ATP-dependent helicase/nuclease subunit A